MDDASREGEIRRAQARGESIREEDREFLRAITAIRSLPALGPVGQGYADEDEAPRGG